MSINFSQLPEISEGQILQLAKDHKIRHILNDSRRVIKSDDAIFFTRKGPNHDAHLLLSELYDEGIRNFVVEKEEDYSRFKQANFFYASSSLKVLQQLALFHRSLFNPVVVGITGSNGKTIVKEWLLQLLSSKFRIIATPHSYNSQLGVPLSVWSMNKNHDLAIFEAGISQPGEMAALEKIIQPSIGIFTNIGSAHDEGFADRTQKIEEKLKLFINCKNLIYCKDHKKIDDIVSGSAIKTFTWGQDKNSDLKIISQKRSGEITAVQLQLENEIHDITFPLSDTASFENLMHCVACMLVLDASWHEIRDRISLITPVAMRLELKKGISGCYLIDDSYNNDLAGLKIALDFLKQQRQHKKKTVILSDIYQSGLQPEYLYKEVNHLLEQHNIERLIGIGPEISLNKKVFSLQTEFYATTSEFLSQTSSIEFNQEMILIKGARAFTFELIVNRLQEKIHGTRLEINLGAITHNLNFFRSCLKKETRLMVMVKAFSYGSGTHEIANFLQYHKVDYFGVAYTDEGVHLRKHGIEIPIMIMNPSPEGYEQLLQYELEPEVYGFHQFHSLQKFLQGRSLKIHIKLDTGMHRLGFEKADLDGLIEGLQKNRNFAVASIFSHMAAADDESHEDFSRQQAADFYELSDYICGKLNIKPLRHLLNSPGIVRFPEYQLDMVRLGIGLYGIEPSGLEQGQLLPVSTLKTIISQIRNVDAGNTIGYGRKGKVMEDKRIATIAIGYADGFSRFFSNGKGEVSVNGKRAPVIGNVCMDMTMIDITGIEANEGDEVIIFGEDPTINELAENIGTIPYEILTNVSERVTRIYLYD